MTKPTQAQIEAALKAFHHVEHAMGLPVRLAAALNAAAEVAEKSAEFTWGYRHGFAGATEAIVAEREACAQVAEKFENGPLRFEIAAAIRARKS